MGDIKNKTVNIYIDQSAAEAALDKLQSKADGFNKKIEECRQKQSALNDKIKASEEAGKSTTKLQSQYQSLGKQISDLNSKLEDNASAQKKVQEQIDNGLKPSFAQQEKLVISLRNQLKQMSEDAPGYADKFKSFQVASHELDRMRIAMNGVEKAQNSWLQEAKVVAFGVLIGNTVQQAIGAIGSYLSGIVTGNAKLSDTLADLQRVTGASATEVKDLYQQLKNIDTRTSTSGLLNIAIIAGKLGVAKGDIASFTEAVDKLQVALGDELGDADQITEQLGKILNVFDGKVDASNITTLGNTIVDLANKGIASGPFLVDFAQRVSGIAKASNLSLPAVLGLASGLEASGAKVESSSTAIQTLLTKIGTDLPKAAQIAGVPVDKFNQLFADKPQEALLQYAAGLQKNKASFAEVASGFKDAGEDGARTIAVLSTLGLKTDYFRQQMEQAGVAIKNTNEIQDAFNLKNGTLGAQLDKLGKSFNGLITSKSLSEFFASAVSGLNNFINALKAAPEWIKENQSAIYLIIVGIAVMNASYIKAGLLIIKDTALKIYNATVTKALAAAVDVVTAAQLAYAEIIALVNGEITLAVAAQRLWTIALTLGAGPIGILIVAAGALIVALKYLTDGTSKLTAAQRINNEIQDKVSSSYVEQKETIKELTDVLNSNNTSLEAKKIALQKLIDINPDYLKGLTLENIKTAEGKKLIDDYITSLQTKAAAEAKQSLLTDKLKQQAEDYVKLRQDKLFKNASDDQIERSANFEKTTDESSFIATNRTVNGVKLSDVAKNNEEIKLLQKDLTVFTKKQIDETVKSQQDSNKNTVTDSATTIAVLEKQLQDLQDARKLIDVKNIKQLDENKTKIISTQNELAKYQISSIEKASTADDHKHDELLKAAEDFNKKVRDLNQTSADASKTQNQKEIDDIKHKYDEVLISYNALVSKLKGTNIKLSVNSEDIKKLENDEIAGTIKKQQTADFEKQTKEEYTRALADSDAYYASEKKLEAQRFVDGEVDHKTYQASLLRIDDESKQQAVKIANDYAATVKQAESDITKFQKDELEKRVQAMAAFYQLQQKNAQQYKELQNTVAFTNEQTNVDVSKDGSREQFEAKKKLLDLDLQLTIEELTKKRNAEILSVQSEYQEELKITLLKLEDAKRVELAQIKSDDPEAEKKKAEINQRYQLAEGQARVETEQKTQSQVFSISQNFIQLIQDATKERNKKSEDETNNWLSAQIAKYQGYANSVISIWDQINQVKNSKEQAAFNAESSRNDRLKKQYQTLLNGKLLTQQEFNIRTANLDAELEKKKEDLAKKEFERNKKQQIAQTIINGAAGAIKLWIDPGFPAAIPLEILLAAETIAEVATIASQKPSFGKGGKLTGPAHADGGMPVINPITGEKEAEVEGGEYILSKSTVVNNKKVADALLDTSMNKGGAAIDPDYFSRTYRPIDTKSITKAYQTTKFANGGVYPGASSNNNTPASAPATDPALLETLNANNNMLNSLATTITKLHARLDKPIDANVSLKKLSDAQSQQDRILADADFKQG